ncbi:alpha/beta hydrolase [Oscillochloris sp. ZM17-4]|uniref:alpha/beta fold hydrolase n=1 Tax=Oscillochloris sp. ZM17-4 TaxID=2866714 RepID=UPI001C7353CE|nr:alpha/beta hydrolase [Oscillochloris sp. ZM17-4]
MNQLLPTYRAPPWLAGIWNRRLLGVALAVGIAALAGVLVSVIVPRGPTTQAQALLVLAGGALVGALAGLVMRSRWALLLAPLVHIAALELARPQLLGPTAGAIRLDNTYGILAFVLGRGLYGLVAVIPMILGAYLGTVLARELSGSSPRSGMAVWRWVLPALATLLLAALAIGFALPASTPPILGADGKSLPGSIAELTTVRLGGHDQTIMIRGYSADKPVLLYLNGGPGMSGLPFTRVVLDDLSHDFVIVDWDQRGTGKSYAALDPTATLTLDQAINDTIELTNYLRQRFDEPKIYVVGESWGSILGVLAVQRQPELFYAFIGSGQMVNVRETDRRFYQDVLDLAARNGDTQLAAQMRAYGQPPYADIPYANIFAMEQYESLYQPYTPSQAYMDLGNAAGIGPYGVLASEYNLVEKFNVLRGLIDTFTVLYPQLQEVDFRRDVPRLDTPVYILDGTAELAARRDLTQEWFGALEAPTKRMFTLDNAAHSVAFEQFAQFGTIMRETVLPETYEGR